jgi:hypothetical protein
MTQADSVLSTPPTNTSAIDHPMMFPPRDPTRLRFLTVAAVASAVGTGSFAAAAMAPNVPQAATIARAAPVCPGIAPSSADRGAVMSEVAARDVLADLFGSGDFPPEILPDTAHAADVVIQRLLDAGFEIKPAKD